MLANDDLSQSFAENKNSGADTEGLLIHEDFDNAGMLNGFAHVLKISYFFSSEAESIIFVIVLCRYSIIFCGILASSY
jgi:hypothetical protein